MRKNTEIPSSRGRCWKGVLLCLAPFAAASLASGQSVYEGFDYTAGESVENDTLNGGNGFSAEWVSSNAPQRQDAVVDTSGMTYSDGTNDLLTTGLSFTGTSISNQAVDVERNFSSTFGGDFWASWLIESDNVTDADHRTLLKDDAGTNFIYTTLLGDSISIGTNIGSVSDVTALGSASADTTYFITLNYRRVTGTSNDELEIWINSDLGGSAPANAIGNATLTMAGGDFGAAEQFRWRMINEGSNGTGKLDEIRVGTSFNDVSPVPEPGAYALLAGLSGLVWVMLRRRR